MTFGWTHVIPAQVNEPYNGPIPVTEIIAAVAVVALLAWLYWRSRR